MNLQEFLGRRGVEFEEIDHSPTFDAQHLAGAIHVSGYHVAKTVLLRVDDGQFVVAVLPATHQVVLDKARGLLAATKVELASEEEVARRCPDCEVGALPPFGSHHDMQTLVDQTLLADEHLIFEGNTHTNAVRMKSDDFVKLEKPLRGTFAQRVSTAESQQRSS